DAWPRRRDRQGHGRGGLAALRSCRRGALREDGPQRHRVRHDAGLRRRVRPDAQRATRPGAGGVALHARCRCGRRTGAARQRRDVVAARPDGAGPPRAARPRTLLGLRAGLGRGPLDGADGRRGRRAGARADGGALHPLPIAAGGQLRRQDAVGDAREVRRPRGAGEGRVNLLPPSVRPGGRATLVADPAVVVIFGVSGDLAERKLLPAFGNLRASGRLPEDVLVLGVLRRPADEDALRRTLLAQLHGEADDGEVREWLGARVRFVVGDTDDDDVYRAIGRVIDEWADGAGKPANALFYLA